MPLFERRWSLLRAWRSVVPFVPACLRFTATASDSDSISISTMATRRLSPPPDEPLLVLRCEMEGATTIAGGEEAFLGS